MNRLCSCVLGLLFFIYPGIACPPTNDLDLSTMIQPVDSSSFIRNPAYYHWCHSIVKESENHYYLFYARWPKSLGFYAWLTHSEIALAESDHILGPYRNSRTILLPRKDKWDAVTMHNVQVRRFHDKYYLYYTSTNTGARPITDSELTSVGKQGYSHALWGTLRSNQRPGVAVAENPMGEWKRFDRPIVEPSGPIKNVAVNPTVCEGPDNKYHLIIKGDDVSSKTWRLIQANGVSDSPEGPFVLEEKSAFSEIPSEDMFLWYDKKRLRYYAIFHSHGDNFIGLITSTDGKSWEKAQNYKVCRKEIPLKDGTVMQVDRMERPSVYIEDGLPKALSFAVKKGDESFIVILPLKSNAE